MTPSTQSTMACHQCGREGTRGFREIPEVTVDWLRDSNGDPYPPFTVGPFTECANKNACRKRWPRQPDVEY